MNTEEIKFLDITEPQIVEILIRRDGKVLWVNIDGMCVFRACRIKTLSIVDERKTNDERRTSR